MCVAASASEALEAPGAYIPFMLEPILPKIEGGRYMGPILTVILSDRLVGRRPGSGSGSSGNSGLVCGSVTKY